METLRVYPIYHREVQQVALQYPYIQGSAVDKKVRGLSGRKYSKTKGCWYIPYRDDYRKYIKDEFAAIDNIKIIFPPDHEDVPVKEQNGNEGIPSIKAYLLIDKNKKKYFLKHDYHVVFFQKIFKSKLAYWNKNKKYWLFEKENYQQIKDLLHSENCSIEEKVFEGTKDSPVSSKAGKKKDDIQLDQTGRDTLRDYNHTMQIRRLSERIQGRKTMFFNLNSEYEKLNLSLINGSWQLAMGNKAVGKGSINIK